MKNLFIFCCLILFGKGYTQQPVADVDFPVSGGRFIYDPISKGMLLIGGQNILPDSVKTNVWKWDRKKWSKIVLPGPGSRDFFMGGMNTKTGVIHLFGGMDGSSNSKADMWTFNGKAWISLAINPIGTRDHHNMAFAENLDAFVLYGGNHNGYPNYDSATWLFSNGQFKKLDIPGPGARWHHGMVYDKDRQKIVLYGGGEKPDEHWEFDGVRWSKIVTKENPGKKFYQQMVYHEDLKLTILHGGWVDQNPRNPVNHETPITWSWDGKTWKKIASANIFAVSMGYDPLRKVVWAYGHSGPSNDSDWLLCELKDNKWIIVQNYGKLNTAEFIKSRVEQNPEDMAALEKYADILQWQTKQYAEAEQAYKRLVKAYPQKNNLLIELSLVLAMQGKVEEADEFLKDAINAGVVNKYTYLRLAGLLAQQKKYNASIKYQLKALETEPKGNEFFQVACNYSMLGNKDKAFEALYRAVALGYSAKKDYENDTDLKPLQSDRRWTQLLEKLK